MAINSYNCDGWWFNIQQTNLKEGCCFCFLSIQFSWWCAQICWRLDTEEITSLIDIWVIWLNATVFFCKSGSGTVCSCHQTLVLCTLFGYARLLFHFKLLEEFKVILHADEKCLHTLVLHVLSFIVVFMTR